MIPIPGTIVHWQPTTYAGSGRTMRAWIAWTLVPGDRGQAPYWLGAVMRRDPSGAVVCDLWARMEDPMWAHAHPDPARRRPMTYLLHSGDQVIQQARADLAPDEWQRFVAASCVLPADERDG
jgi:TorA maturation chaperone TorD